ncbi:pyruvate kinase [Pasteurella multocida]|uniref:pyruvate kinase n=1 Tax=Pasteurella multocida TaxID=747 RepID=UPI0020241C04|nr:pyruvate kinase [Pasteurella multocida]URJ84918.1 pyruvate kinase [Pasteurella multocida]
MKEFDLEKALAGEPILTRDHQKGYVKFTIEENSKIKKLVGIVHNGCLTEVEEWLPSGNILSDDITPNDIIGMYEELRPTATINFTCPLKEIEEGQEFWHIVQDSDPLGIAWAKVDVSMSVFNKDNIYHSSLLDAGLAFKSEKDVKAWLDAMKNARR